MKKTTLLLIVLAAFGLQGCFNSSMMTTAKTLDKGEQEVTLGASVYSANNQFAGVAPEIMYRRGINDKLDFGLCYSLGLYGHFRADMKYELLNWNNGNSFLSSGFGFDAYIPDEFGNDSQLFGSTIPLYLSFNHDKNVTPYFGQRFTFGWNGLNTYKYLGSNEPITEFTVSNHSVFYTGAVGLQFGEKRKAFHIEFSYSYVGNNYFGAWEDFNAPGEYVTISEFDRDWRGQITLAYVFGNRKKK